MRLQKEDLMNYCKCIDWKSSGKYSLKAEKSEYGYWKLEIVKNENGESENLTSGLTLREAHEFVRAFYRGLEYGKILEFNQ